jgi:hypothetical protein
MELLKYEVIWGGGGALVGRYCRLKLDRSLIYLGGRR